MQLTFGKVSMLVEAPFPPVIMSPAIGKLLYEIQRPKAREDFD